MSLLQINLSPDLLRLREIGYNIEITETAYLVVRDIPYVNSAKKIYRGILVSKLDLAGDRTDTPKDHTIMFGGDFPCYADGRQMDMLGNPGGGTTSLGNGLEINHTFSRKPSRGHYLNYFEKIETYVSLISREAGFIDKTVTALTFEVVEPQIQDYPFNYLDTASARSEINEISTKLVKEKIAIIGVGGTGSYVLDFVAKTPVREIHLFDGDKFSTHNAFRTPGAASLEELREQPKKVHYHEKHYRNISRRITVHDIDINASNVDLLRNMTFVFLCIDPGPNKKAIVEKLEEFDIPFVDTGIGLYSKGDSLGGKVRLTTSLPGRRASARENIPWSGGGPEDEYDKNIQIIELNALNACLAVIRWKKLRGFYLDSEQEQLTTYTVNFNMLISEDLK